ncbi:MAG: hypothetical protein IT331_24595 [Anaerolineae bacterium]|nr:hypothetical protein [Anaerolineae bacterium]
MLLAKKTVDWQQFRGRTFETIAGAQFTVIRVTSEKVTVHPERGTHNYAISIQEELERVLNDYVVGRFFPSPAELISSGVRPVPSTYVWGILHALLSGEKSAKSNEPRSKDFAGQWRIIGFSELDEDYFTESDEPPFIQLRLFQQGRINGRYHFGLSHGTLEGEIREFGGERVLLLRYEGSDEMDALNGAGWLQLTDRELLSGEFLGDYGRFTARRAHVPPMRARNKARVTG